MTLSVALARRNGLLSMSDLMISSSINQGDILIPTRTREPAPPCGGRYTSGLLQKIVVINEKIMILWAGSPVHARVLTEAFFSNLSSLSCITANQIEKVLSDIEMIDISNVNAFIAFVDKSKDGTIKIRSWVLNSGRYTLPPFDEIVSLESSGTDDFYKSIEEAFRGEDLDSVNALDLLDYSLSFMAVALQRQERTSYGFDNSWGGGAQFVMRRFDKFVRLDNILIRRWHVKNGMDGPIICADGNKYIFKYDKNALLCASIKESDASVFVIGTVMNRQENFRWRGKASPDYIVDVFDIADLLGQKNEALISHVTLCEVMISSDNFEIRDDIIDIYTDTAYLEQIFDKIYGGLCNNPSHLFDRQRCEFAGI